MSQVGKERILIGVIGLGRLWEARHRPALLRLCDQFQITMVYDQVARRAEREARQLGCAATRSMMELVQSDRVDAVYLLTPQWFGLHPIGLCVEARKPVYSALALAAYPCEVDILAQRIKSHAIPFMAEMPRRCYPATLRLRELLATTLGRPRLIVGQVRLQGFDRYGDPGPSRQTAPATLLIDPGCNLIDWSRFLVGEEPSEIRGDAAGLLSSAESDWGPDYQQLQLRFPGGTIVSLWIARYQQNAWGEADQFLPRPGFQVYTERGAAWVEFPDRIRWWDDQGSHEELLPMEPTMGERLALQFAGLIRGESSLCPTLDDVLATSRLVRGLSQNP